MPIAHVNIGSNLGNSEALIDRAVSLIASRLGVGVKRALIERSMPWGYDSTRPYLNLGIAFETTMEPAVLLDVLLEIQAEIDPAPHRDPSGDYIDRAIDIDLIALGRQTIDTPSLTLPHPRMHLRPFVLRPMAVLEPEWVHPRLGLTPACLLGRLSEKEG
ncbi:MAG: 2-amino-4-hydroxy-6-hydroxymethyldihydropteridine diphosphokinase [Pseudoflavonifractor sp.]|nr:2-amino-4-hydroxy-6-hydroxymethyldihydropteridine diphosphokinase [Alloprevotella sp.]MCM1116166.1 2-amino-4-hydroxy-6-hydroxymethyldihydropteridine diphosphokinase [Pseudoflavonifractor sp.]